MEEYKPRRFDLALEKNLIAIEVFGKILWIRWRENSLWILCRDWNMGWFYMLSLGKIEIGCRMVYKQDTLH